MSGPASTSGTGTNADLPPSIASTALRKLVALELTSAGFDSADEEALEELEGVVYAFFGALLQHSHDLALHGHRTRVNLKDIVTGCAELGVGRARDLIDVILERPGGDNDEEIRIAYEPPLPVQAKVVTLDSDDDSGPEDVPVMNRDGTPARKDSRRLLIQKHEAFLVADYLPPLPPKHAYRRTPVFPKTATPPAIPAPSSALLQLPTGLALAHISTIRSRLSNSQKVADSLRNLIRATSSSSVLREEKLLELPLSEAVAGAAVELVMGNAEAAGPAMLDEEAMLPTLNLDLPSSDTLPSLAVPVVLIAESSTPSGDAAVPSLDPSVPTSEAAAPSTRVPAPVLEGYTSTVETTALAPTTLEPAATAVEAPALPALDNASLLVDTAMSLDDLPAPLFDPAYSLLDPSLSLFDPAALAQAFGPMDSTLDALSSLTDGGNPLLAQAPLEASGAPAPEPTPFETMETIVPATEEKERPLGSDVISFESDWYASADPPPTGGKRALHVLRVGRGGVEDNLEQDGETRNWETAGVGGTAGKRRKWRV